MDLMGFRNHMKEESGRLKKMSKQFCFIDTVSAIHDSSGGYEYIFRVFLGYVRLGKVRLD